MYHPTNRINNTIKMAADTKESQEVLYIHSETYGLWSSAESKLCELTY